MDWITWTVPGVIGSSGLFLDIIGVSLLFRFGLPPVVSKTGDIIYSIGVNEKEIQKARRYDRLSRAALYCLAVGFVLQIVSNFLI